jgi:hypothetical protein
MLKLRVQSCLSAAAIALCCGLAVPVAYAQETPPPGAAPEKKEEFRPFAEVSKGFDKVVSTADGQAFYTLWKKEKDGSMLAELPRGFEGQRHFFAMTVATGQDYAGLQAGDMYVYWKRIDNRLMLIEPQIDTKSTGDQESKLSVKGLFTDRVVLDVAIVTMGPSGQPVIDMKDLLVGKATTFFGGEAAGANGRLALIKKAKSFPENIEIAYEMPSAGGRLKSFHYSISLLKENPSYKPRVADARIGYFTTTYRDLGKFTDKEKWVRYINRWHVEKKDASRKLSPPKEPIVFYIDAAVPARYRRYVRDGVMVWNKAFERVGILEAIEVRQQDAETGAYMELDPEDVRYNFVRWLSNDQGTAIGPSRVNPNTGQILDADVILTDGWIRHFWVQYNDFMPELAMEGMSAETIAWLDRNPKWDPRVRMADPADRDAIIARNMKQAMQRAMAGSEGSRVGVLGYGGRAVNLGGSPSSNDGSVTLMGTQELDGLINRTSQMNGLCLASKGKSFDMAYSRMMFELVADDLSEMENPEAAAADAKKDEGKKDDAKKDDKKEEGKKDEKKYDSLDGIPDWFVGPLLADLVQHEIGHTIGLRHNFKASTQYTLAQINSDEVKGKKAFTSSVMDYTPVNFPGPDGKMKGDVAMIDVGDYDNWAIEFGYGFGDPKEVAKRSAEPGHDYGTDEDVGGPDPSIQRYDFAKDPLNYAKAQLELATYHRSRLLDKFVKDGESYAKVRRGYEMTLAMQTRGLTMLSPWIGGTFVHRDQKGDPGARPPMVVVPAQTQRDALRQIIDTSFYDDVYGLTPALLEKMTVDKWLDWGGAGEARQDNTYSVHDRIGGIQAMVLTRLMNPTTLRRVLDNEFKVPSDQDAMTLPELLDTVAVAAWSELDKSPSGSFTARKPYISSLRRNLQREHLERMIDLTLPGAGSGEAFKAISNLAIFRLRQLDDKITSIIGEKGDKAGGLDAYSLAHLSEAKMRIGKALDAQYIYNQSGGAMTFPFSFMFGQPLPAMPGSVPHAPVNMGDTVSPGEEK